MIQSCFRWYSMVKCVLFMLGFAFQRLYNKPTGKHPCIKWYKKYISCSWKENLQKQLGGVKEGVHQLLSHAYFLLRFNCWNGWISRKRIFTILLCLSFKAILKDITIKQSVQPVQHVILPGIPSDNPEYKRGQQTSDHGGLDDFRFINVLSDNTRRCRPWLKPRSRRPYWQ